MPGLLSASTKRRSGKRRAGPAYSAVKAVYLATYLFGFFLACPMLAITAIAYAQQADFAVALGALVALAVVWKATAAAWRRLPG